MTTRSTRFGWAVKWRGENRLDGVTEHLIGCAVIDRHDALSGYNIATFATREQARKWKKERCGYISKRSDLRREPHGWKTPTVVKVRVTVEEFES